MTNLRKWSTTASGNATIAGGVSTVNLAEGQAPSTVNNSLREAFAQIRKTYTPDEWGWVDCSATASVASQTTFKLTGDQSSDYTATRRFRLKSGSTTRYGTIVSSSFTTETTVTITVDSGSLSASHTLAAVAAIDNNHIPGNTYVTSNSLSAALSTLGTYITSASASAAIATAVLNKPEVIMVAVSDETTAITTGAAKLTFRMPYAFTLTSVRASLTTASSSGTPTVDINEGGTTILSTKLTIDANELTSTTAATAAVISDSSLANDALMTIDIDVAGTGAKGLKVYLLGHQ